MNIFGKIADNVADARKVGPGFVARHLTPWRSRHRFSYKGRPLTIRAGGVDSQVVRYLLVNGEYNLVPTAKARVRARYDAILAAGRTPVIVDAGGNIGTTAVWFANDYPQAKVVTIEMEAGNFAILSENVRAWPNVIPLHAAIGDPAKSPFVAAAGSESWAFRPDFSEGGTIPVVSVQQAKEAAGPNGELLIVKIDIEGSERELFSGDCAWLDEVQCVMIEPHDWLRPQEDTSRTFQLEIGKRNFSVFLQSNNLIYVRRA
ncbi:MAG: FkbM family methyltransferase [Phenylobacterium sp.]